MLPCYCVLTKEKLEAAPGGDFTWMDSCDSSFQNDTYLCCMLPIPPRLRAPTPTFKVPASCWKIDS